MTEITTDKRDHWIIEWNTCRKAQGNVHRSIRRNVDEGKGQEIFGRFEIISFKEANSLLRLTFTRMETKITVEPFFCNNEMSERNDSRRVGPITWSGKNWELENVTRNNLLASKFLSLIGKSTTMVSYRRKTKAVFLMLLHLEKYYINTRTITF